MPPPTATAVDPAPDASPTAEPVAVVESGPPLPPQTDGAGTIPLTALHLSPSVVEPGILLPVPYRSQLDGSLYARANCGPASLGMILDAYDVHVPTRVIRDEANRRQRSYGYGDGVGAEVLKAIAEGYGLRASDLFDLSGYKVWTPDDLRERLQAGLPVMTLVKYRSLPGVGPTRSESDHYIVITGLSGRNFIFNDPALVTTSGYGRLISPENLEEAWDLSGIPHQAMAFGPPAGHPPLPVERINGLEDIRRLLPLTAVMASPLAPERAEAAELDTAPVPAPEGQTVEGEPEFPKVDREPRPTWTPTPLLEVAGAPGEGPGTEGNDAQPPAGNRRVAVPPAPVTVLRVVAEWLRVVMQAVDRMVGHTPVDGWQV